MSLIIGRPHILNSGLTTSLEKLLPTAPRALEPNEKFQTEALTSYFDIPTTMLGISVGMSYPRPTDIQKISKPLNEKDNPVYTSASASFTGSGIKHSVIPTTGFANDSSRTFSSILSTEVLREDAAIENSIESQLPTAKLVKSNTSLADRPEVIKYPWMLPPMSKEEAVLTGISPVSNEFPLVSIKASSALPPQKDQSRTNTLIVPTPTRLDGPPTLPYEYPKDSSPTWVVSDQIWHIPKPPGNSLHQANTIISGSFHTSLTDKTLEPPWASDSCQCTKPKSVLYDLSKTLPECTPTSRSYDEISSLGSPNSSSTQTSKTETFTTSPTSEAKPSNENDLTMSGSKASHYMEKRRLGIILGSVSGAGIILCAVFILHRPCYRRFRGSRKRTIGIVQSSENLNDGSTSFARHSDYREISRFSVDS